VQTPQAAAAAGPYGPNCWRADRLPMLGTIGPLLPGAPDKRPLVGNDWEAHAGVGISELQAAAPECICWHVGAAPGHIAIDIDGPRAAAFCQQHSCEPYTADTWRIVRTGNTDRLKLVYTVTTEQKAALVSGAKTVKVGAGDGGLDDKGEELAVFAKPGTQIVVLGNHYTKESGFTENDDQYAWAGRAPADAQPLPPEWFALLTGVFCGERPLRPKTRRSVSDSSTRGARSYSGASGTWRNSSQRQPCPMCGRDHSGACSIHQDNDSVWCCHGETKSAPDCSNKGEIVTGRDARTWAYVRTEDHDSFGERSLFVLHKPKPKPDPPTPPLNGEPFIPSDADEPAGQAANQQIEPDEEGDEIERQELAVEIRNYRDVAAAAELASIELAFPPGLASFINTYAKEQMLKPCGFLLPILCSVTSVIGNRARVAMTPTHSWKESCVLWGANIATASSGKSPTSSPTTLQAFKPWQAQERKNHADALSDWKHRRAQVERDVKSAASETGGAGGDLMAQFLAENPQPELRHLLVSDATFERIEMILSNGSNPGLLAVHDELAGWFSQLCRAPNRSDRAKWLSLYPGEQLITDRVGRDSIFVPNPAVSLFGSLQPARLEGLWKADAEANEGMADADGLWSRFLMFDLGEWAYEYQDSTVLIAPVISNLYKQVDAAASKLPIGDDGEPIIITVAEDAKATMIQWVRQAESFKFAASDPSDRQYWGKQRGATLRIALAIHAIRQASAGLSLNTPISEEVIRAAIIFTALFARERDKVLGPVRTGAGGAIKRLIDKGREWRQQNGSRPVPQSQIRAWCLPARRAPAAEVRTWLLGVVAETPDCGQVIRKGKAVEWLPPGD
jgi:hypothetical protein